MALCAGLTLVGCGHTQLFPVDVAADTDRNFDFTAWRTIPNAKTGQKVELGGRIVQVNSTADGVVIIVTQLPIVQQPAYGPKDGGRRSGEFAIRYNGTLNAKWLRAGNRLIVIGTTEQARVVVVDDVQRNLPSLAGRCLHVWNTGGKEIAEFPYNAGGGYEPLEEETLCTVQP